MTVTVEKTDIASAVELLNGMRQIARKSNGDIVALIQQSGGVCFPWISTDDGATWTQGDTDFGFAADDGTLSPSQVRGSRAGVSLAVDSADSFHACGITGGTLSYYQFTIAGGGTVTTNVSNEEVDADGLWGEIVVDNSDVPWIFGMWGNRIMGTTYRQTRLWNRSGSSWTALSDVDPDVGGEFYFGMPQACFDANGDLHLIYAQNNGNARYNVWDVSAGSLTGRLGVDPRSTIKYGGHFVVYEGVVYVIHDLWIYYMNIGSSRFEKRWFSLKEAFSQDDGEYRPTIGVSKDMLFTVDPYDRSDPLISQGTPAIRQYMGGYSRFESITGTTATASIYFSQFHYNETDRGALDTLIYDWTNGAMKYCNFAPVGNSFRANDNGVFETNVVAETLMSDFAGTRDRYWIPGGLFGPFEREYEGFMAYNPVEDDWSKIGNVENTDNSLVSQRQAGGAIAYADSIFHIGGITGGPIFFDDVTEYRATDGLSYDKSPMPTARAYTATGRVDGDTVAYAIAGWGTGSVYSAANESYDLVNDTWSTAPTDMPSTARRVDGIGSDTEIFVIGGYDGSSFYDVVEAYDPSTDTWRTGLTAKPTGTHREGIATFDGKIYCLGGAASIGHVAVNEIYDVAADTWSTGTALPGNPRSFLTAFEHDGLIHAIGGRDGNPYDRHDVYDPATDTWDTSFTNVPLAFNNGLAAQHSVRA